MLLPKQAAVSFNFSYSSSMPLRSGFELRLLPRARCAVRSCPLSGHARLYAWFRLTLALASPVLSASADGGVDYSWMLHHWAPAARKRESYLLTASLRTAQCVHAIQAWFGETGRAICRGVGWPMTSYRSSVTNVPFLSSAAELRPKRFCATPWTSLLAFSHVRTSNRIFSG